MQNLALAALKAAYINKEITPKALMTSLREQALEQADYNAWITLLSEDQISTYLTYLEDKQPEELPLYGVPFAIKDNIDLAGVPTTAACADFEYVPEKSAFVVELLMKAGAIPLGKTNLDQFATGLVGTRSPYGEGKNSFNPDYISGGSSAGSAIATALGQVSFALGTDTAGSGRVPAALNNLIGHKPSKGLLSTSGVVPACRTLDCVSIFSLNTDDAATVLQVAAQYDEQDAYARENRYDNLVRYYSNQVPASFKFGVPTDLEFNGNSETESLFSKSIEQLVQLGGEPVEINFAPFIESAKLLYEGPWVAERWLATENVAAESMLDVIATIVKNGNESTAADGFSAQYKLQTLKKQCDKLMEGLAFVLTPTTPTVFTREEIAKDPIKNNSILGTYTNFMNLLDYAATAVPVGITENGVPWGVTLFSHAFSDMKLLSYSGALQKAIGLPQGATDNSLPESAPVVVPAVKEQIQVVVCGAHLEGQPLNWQLIERGATLVSKTHSSENYALFALADGIRPGMVRNEDNGSAIEVEIWSLPKENFGSFVAGIPEPLGIGKVEMSDGQWLSGFICEASGLKGARDVTEFKGWRAWLAHKATF